MNLKFLTLSLFSSLLLFSVSSQAQDDSDKQEFTVGSEVVFENVEPTKKSSAPPKMPELGKDAEVTIVHDEKINDYVDLSVQNISKLYWKIGILPLTNDLAIDNFLLINECDIYTKFYNDDFEWPRVREAGRKMIEANKDVFPTQFKMMVPVDLGRYDMKRKGFPLINGTAYRNMRRVEIGDNAYSSRICGVGGFIKFYPKNIMMILNKPFVYDFVSVDEHIAQAFIVRRKYETFEGPRHIQRNFERPAFARIRITLKEYQGEANNQDREPLAIMVGKIDGVDIFEDQGEKRLLSSVDFDD
jgi:hypothetical protein